MQVGDLVVSKYDVAELEKYIGGIHGNELRIGYNHYKKLDIIPLEKLVIDSKYLINDVVYIKDEDKIDVVKSVRGNLVELSCGKYEIISIEDCLFADPLFNISLYIDNNKFIPRLGDVYYYIDRCDCWYEDIKIEICCKEIHVEKFRTSYAAILDECLSYQDDIVCEICRCLV